MVSSVLCKMKVLGLALVIAACSSKDTPKKTKASMDSEGGKIAKSAASQPSPTPDTAPTKPEVSGAEKDDVVGTDFDALAQKVIADNFQDQELQNELWIALYKQEQWHLMTFPDSKSIPPGLNIETHDGKRWVMAFTDTDKLYAYAKERGQLNADGTMVGMSVPAKTSFEFIEGLQGIAGVRFNQGDSGWFAPTGNLRAIHSHLVKLGRL